MGTIYLGEHILLGRRAAIKTLLPALSMQREIVDRFFNEARATSGISDAGVVQVFDFGYHVDGAAYIVMELLEGESLQARIDRLGQVPVGDALRIARQVAGSLAAAHERGIVHRDLKPENVFLIRDAEAQSGERTKILDFGICKLGSDDVSLTASGTTLGTPVYMSPEQCRGAGKVDHRSDIYALGCVLFHMLVGRPPFEAEGAGEYIVAHLQQEPQLASELVPALPPSVDAVIMRCLAKDPDDRFQTMGELQVELGQVLANISAPKLDVAPAHAAMPLGQGFKSAYNVNLGTQVPTQDGPGAPVSSGVREKQWFLSKTPTPTTLNTATGEAEAVWPERRTGLKVTLAIMGVAAAIAAVLAMQFTVGGDEASAEPSTAEAIAEMTKPSATAPVPEPTPAPTAAPAAAPAPAVIEGREPATDEPAPVPMAIAAPALEPEPTPEATPEPKVETKPAAKAATKNSKEAKKAKKVTKRPKWRPARRVQTDDDEDTGRLMPPGTTTPTTAPAPAKPASPASNEDLYDTR